MISKIFVTRSTLAFLLASASIPALAQTADDPSSGGLQDIVVTAERRTQSLQKVPISATVLTGDDLQEKGVANLGDIQQVAPSVAINTYNRSTFINIRGVGIAQSAPTSSTGVAYYIDGVFIPNEQYIGFSFFDFSSVEVLRGPQGTLTGQNSTGGALYVRTPDPDFSRLSGYIEETVGNYEQFRTIGAVNVPISSNVALRVAGIYDKRDSFSKQIGTSPSNPGNVDFYAFRSNLLIEPSSSLGINLRWEHFNNDSDNNAVTNRTLLPTVGPRVVKEDAISFLRNVGNRYSGEVRLDLSDAVRWRTNISYQDAYTRDQADGDRTDTALPRPPASNTGRVSLIDTTHKIFIAETNLLSTGNAPLQWVAGAFYMHGDVGLDQRRDNNNTVTFVSSTSTILADATNTTKAGFGQINYKPSDAIEFIVGARYSEDKQVYTRNGATDVQKSDKLTGRIAVNFYPTENVTLYATASRGYKAGGVNLSTGVAPFGPEENTVYELGFKTSLLDRHLRVNGDVFYSDYKDIQFSSLFNGLPVTQNAASARSKGAELEVTGQFDALAFNMGVGYLDAKFAQSICLNNTNNPRGDRVRCASSATPTTADDFVPEDRRLPFAPKWTINGGIQYAIPLGNATLTPRVQWSHVSSQYATPFPAVATIVPGRDIVDLRATLEPNERFLIEGFVTNLFDKLYIASQVQNASSADGGIIYGAPRQFGARVRVKLGPL